LHLIAIVQIRDPSAGRAYYPTQTGREQVPQGSPALPERRLSDAVYRQLLADQHRPAQVQP
jgi:hypothetical protein